MREREARESGAWSFQEARIGSLGLARSIKLAGKLSKMVIRS